MIKKFIYRVKEMKKTRKCVLMLASLCLVVAAMFGVTATESFAAEVAGGVRLKTVRKQRKRAEIFR